MTGPGSDRDASGAFLVRATRVGVWTGALAEGSLVGEGSPAGSIEQVGHRHPVAVPPGARGRVALVHGSERALTVAYGEVLFRIVPMDDGRATTSTPESVAASRGLSGVQVKAPTDGVFYLSPTPGAKPYVAVGDRVTAGQPIGLIEVMKTFNPIAYGGAALPESAEVIEILAGDGQEVRAGQPLVTLR
jgi:biotin carboxyl carrier protein